MGCGSCSTRGGGLPKGCNNNGSCGAGGCNKLEVFDWLANMRSPGSENETDWVEIRFKNTRKEFFINDQKLPLQLGDLVAVEGSPGHDIGIVSLTGELVKLQMKKLRINEKNQEKKVIYRKARENDIKRWQEAIAKEDEFMRYCRRVARDLRLDMKVSDVECQGDGTKATFYYTAEGRVDFRELIKILARDLKVRIEMRQIGYRQEAGRLGGIGVCGRELCCSTWLRDFRSVTTTAARYQQLSINPQKLAGQCGKLKCCLNYELDSYLDALKDFPKGNVKLKTKAGEATLQKTDIFKRILHYSYDANPGVFIPLELEIVKEIIRMNQKGIIPEDLAGFLNEEPKKEKVADYSNVIEEGSLTRFDNKNKHRNKKRKKRQDA
jgi:cell fate regulator YaaT (PSP1 superfamily)